MLDISRRSTTQATRGEYHIPASPEREELISGTLDALPIAILLIDQDFRTIHFNCTASGIIEKKSLFIVDSQGKLQTVGIELSARFRNAVKTLFTEADRHHQRASEIIVAGSYQLLLRPIKTRLKYTHVAVFVFDSEATHAPDRQRLKQIFQFTSAETRLATLLAQGLSIDDAKNILCISRHTARNHLRSIFVKCGVARQADLVRKIVTSAAMLL